jgi:DNA primase
VSIPDEEVAQVRAATDIVALVGEHAGLRQLGRRWVGLCPFHSEKTPSFSVNAQDGFYYCFGCHASGDAITFVRAVEHLDFADAVRFLAQRAGVVLHETDEGSGEGKRRAGLFDAMARAVAWYHERLLTSPDAGPARDYLRSRGYDGETVRRFGLGWAPDDWDALCRSLGVPDPVLVDSGLGFVNRAGRLQDSFRARVLFPIFDPAGRAVAIGGRILPGPGSPGIPNAHARDEPKYKNSPETPIYAKRRTLYALNWAKHDIVGTGEVVVCEGYTDVIGCFAAGIPRAVATCGTALAEDHFRLLHNFGRRIVLAFDADQAGQSAIARVYEWERRHDVDVRVAALPAGADPADLARSDPEALRVAVASAVPFLQFRVDRALAAADLVTAEGRARAAEAALEVVAEHPDELVRDQYVMQVADVARLDPDLLRRRLGERLQRRPSSAAGGAQRGGPRSVDTDGDRPRTAVVHEEVWARRVAGDRDRDGDRDDAGGGGRAGRGGLRNRSRAGRPGLEALRLAVHRPELVADRLEEVLFSDDLQRRTFAALARADDLHQAVDSADPDVAGLLRRLSVEEPVPPEDPRADPAEPVVAQLVREAVRRELAERQAAARTGGGELALVPLAIETATVRRWLEDLDDPSHGREAADRLLAWLGAGQEGP